jgi:hypothetical protein
MSHFCLLSTWWRLVNVLWGDKNLVELWYLLRLFCDICIIYISKDTILFSFDIVMMRKLILLFTSFSIVKFTVGITLLKLLRASWMFAKSVLYTISTSSTYRKYQINLFCSNMSIISVFSAYRRYISEEIKYVGSAHCESLFLLIDVTLKLKIYFFIQTRDNLVISLFRFLLLFCWSYIGLIICGFFLWEHLSTC